jgi:hypothetical protein
MGTSTYPAAFAARAVVAGQPDRPFHIGLPRSEFFLGKLALVRSVARGLHVALNRRARLCVALPIAQFRRTSPLRGRTAAGPESMQLIRPSALGCQNFYVGIEVSW